MRADISFCIAWMLGARVGSVTIRAAPSASRRFLQRLRHDFMNHSAGKPISLSITVSAVIKESTAGYQLLGVVDKQT